MLSAGWSLGVNIRIDKFNIQDSVSVRIFAFDAPEEHFLSLISLIYWRQQKQIGQRIEES